MGRLGVGLVVLAWALPGGAQEEGQRRVGELGRMGPPGRQTVILGVDAPGFESLSPGERALAYHLYRAAVAGDAIFRHQMHRDGPELLALLDQVDLHAEALPPATAAALRDELMRLLAHHGPHDHGNHVKHEPWGLTPPMLAEAARVAESRGATLPRRPGESLDQMLARLTPVLLDPTVEPVHVEQSPGRDPVAGSAVNLYAPGVTLEMVDGLLGFWRHKVNVRVGLNQGKVALEEYRVGGLYSQELWHVTAWLKRALPLAQDKTQRDAIHALIDYYATGDEALFREHSTHWVRSDSSVDFVNGFVETYKDPRGVIGSFEGNVNFAADSDVIKRLAQAAQTLEGRMPWDKRWQRTRVEAPVARVANLLVATGDAGPMAPAGYNLPNYDDIRRTHGSKNVVLLNVEMAGSQEVFRAMVNEFYPEEDRGNALRTGADSRRWSIYLHEVIGHGSGQMDPSVKGSGRGMVGRTAAALEEARAELVALYQVWDAEVFRLGGYRSREEHEAMARGMCVAYVTDVLVALRNQRGDTLRDANARSAALVTGYLLDGGGKKRDLGVKREVRGGKTFHVVTDVKKMRQGVAELLGTLQRMKSLDDDKGATELFARYGTRVDTALRDEVVARAEPLNLPRDRAYVFPRLVPVVVDGQVVDARRVHDEDLLTQQRRFLRLARETTVEEGR
jgi:dipeptidyl-peptidase-3